VDVPGEDRRMAAEATLSRLLRAKIERRRAAVAATEAAVSAAFTDDEMPPMDSVGSLGSFRTSTTNGIEGGSVARPEAAGSMCNCLTGDEAATPLASSSSSSSASPPQLILEEASRADEEENANGDEDDKGGNRLTRPPKIWISKSASMEHSDLE